MTTNTYQSLIEKSKQLEKTIIGSALINPNEIVIVAKIVKPDDFYGENSRLAFTVILDAVIKKQDVQIRMDEAGLNYSDFISIDIRKIEILAQELKKISTAIKLNLLFKKWDDRIDNRNLDESMIRIYQELNLITQNNAKEKTDVKSIVKEFEKEQQLFAEKYKNGQKLLGMSCGFESIDNVSDGIRPGHFWIIGGYNNTGKTSLAMNIIVSVLKQGKRVVVYSMEMSRTDLLGKLMGIISEMNNNKILKGILDEEEEKKQNEAKAILYESKLSIYKDLDDYEEVKMSMYEENMREKVDLFVIDYMQLFKSNDLTEYQLMTKVSSEFQSLGRKTGIPIIAISQISNEVAKSPNSAIGGFKGSGGIESSSDLSLKIVPTEDLAEIQRKQINHIPINVDCYITKNRYGIKGKLPFSFEGYTGKFYEGFEKI